MTGDPVRAGAGASGRIEAAASAPDPAATSTAVDIVATAGAADPAMPPLLILDRVTDFLDEHGLGAGPVTARRIGEGHSNVTFLLTRGSNTFVLRRGPRPPLPPSTHDMLREARLLRALAGSHLPLSEVLAVCVDPALLGVPFYVMDYLPGPIITDTLPAWAADLENRRRIGEAFVDTLVKVHAVDCAAAGLGTFGRPDGYLRRQVDRFAALWERGRRRDLPAVERLADWLGRNLPDSGAPSLVHGDYRLGNLIFDAAGPRVRAVLDWEMATIGDPLADLGYLVATYGEAGQPESPLELSPVTRLPGFPTRAELVARYCERSGRSADALGWYRTLALWKAAIFCEAIYSRWLDGESPDDTTFAPGLERGVPALLELAGRTAT